MELKKQLKLYIRMRYKEQATLNVAKLRNLISSLDFSISRNEPRETQLNILESVKERLDLLDQIISIEHNDFDTFLGN